MIQKLATPPALLCVVAAVNPMTGPVVLIPVSACHPAAIMIGLATIVPITITNTVLVLLIAITRIMVTSRLLNATRPIQTLRLAAARLDIQPSSRLQRLHPLQVEPAVLNCQSVQQYQGFPHSLQACHPLFRRASIPWKLLLQSSGLSFRSVKRLQLPLAMTFWTHHWNLSGNASYHSILPTCLL